MVWGNKRKYQTVYAQNDIQMLYVQNEHTDLFPCAILGKVRRIRNSEIEGIFY